MALSDERIDDLAQNYGLDWLDYEPFARSIEAEVRKDDEAELEAIKSDLNDYMAAANAEANLATELLEQRTQDTALIRQMLEALGLSLPDLRGLALISPTAAEHAERHAAAITAARTRLKS